MKKSQFFTMVELLVVIAIIALLAGISLPVISIASQKGKQTQARTEMNSLLLAFSEFERDYGSLRALPGIDNNSLALNTNDRQLVNPANSVNEPRYYDGVMEALTNTLYDGNASGNLQGSSSKTLAAANPRKKSYFRAPPKMVQDPLVTSGTYSTGYFILDPWGKRYNIAFDYNNDNVINATGFGGESGNIRGKILIFSYGHSKDDNVKNYVCSWKRK